MAKQGDLWDDSALISAFNNAVSKYKTMHGKKADDVSKEKKELVSSSGNHAGIDEHQETKSQEDANDESNLQLHIPTEVGESSNPSEVMETSPMDNPMDPQIPESYAEVNQDYNKLLQQYYELEEKRHQIIQQLHQYGSWNYQYAQEGTNIGMHGDYGTTLHVHEQQTSTQAMSCSCCPYAGQCFVTPCTSNPTCFVGGSCIGEPCTDECRVVDRRKKFPQQDNCIVEAAMGAAEKALSSMRINNLDDSNSTKANKEKETDRKGGGDVQSASSETDLTEVLNAWYSAGFHTGKYLVEQSIAKKHQR